MSKYTAAISSTSIVAGTGVCSTTSGDGGAAVSATFANLLQMRIGANGDLYLVDGSVIRKVDANGIITTVAGTPNVYGYTADGGLATSATLSAPIGLALNVAGDLYFADQREYTVRKVDSGC